MFTKDDRPIPSNQLKDKRMEFLRRAGLREVDQLRSLARPWFRDDSTLRAHRRTTTGRPETRSTAMEGRRMPHLAYREK